MYVWQVDENQQRHVIDAVTSVFKGDSSLISRVAETVAREAAAEIKAPDLYRYENKQLAKNVNMKKPNSGSILGR